MPRQIAPLEAHPLGKVLDARAAAVRAVVDGPLLVDTHGQRFQVEWDPHAPVTPLGQLVFFSQSWPRPGCGAIWCSPARSPSPATTRRSSLISWAR